jgi:hypothetical protein
VAGMAARCDRGSGGEIAQLEVRDIRHDPDGGWFVHIEPGNGKRVKTDRPRSVPLHREVLEEGFLEYVKMLPQDGPAVPRHKPRRGDQARGQVRPWSWTYVRLTEGPSAGSCPLVAAFDGYPACVRRPCVRRSPRRSSGMQGDRRCMTGAGLGGRSRCSARRAWICCRLCCLQTCSRTAQDEGSTAGSGP